MLHLGNYFGHSKVADYVDAIPEARLKRALTEAWVWLEREGMLAPLVEHGRDWVFITRRAQSLIESQDWDSYNRAGLLRGYELAPPLVRKVVPSFLRGDYEPAVFQAFKEVEVTVRRAASLPPEVIGVDLMRKAFNVETGPLALKGRERGERQGISDLFAGAIGYLKNPTSHREVELTDPQEAAEAIIVANYLLRLVDQRSAAEQEIP